MHSLFQNITYKLIGNNYIIFCIIFQRFVGLLTLRSEVFVLFRAFDILSISLTVTATHAFIPIVTKFLIYVLGTKVERAILREFISLPIQNGGHFVGLKRLDRFS